MEYTNHIMKAADAQAVADALEAGTLASPYVVQIDGSNYYDNYPEPDACANWEEGGYESYEDCRCQQYGEDCPEPEPSAMGIWSDDGEGHYTFEITETDTSYWEDNPIYIGDLNSVLFDGGTTDMDITLEYNTGYGGWRLKFDDQSASYKPGHTFYDNGEPDTWNDTGVMSEARDSDAYIMVDWDGDGIFYIYSGSSAHPVSISTYDPEYPAGE